MQDFMDPVASQGAYLETRPNTPTWPPRDLARHIKEFSDVLADGLNRFLSGRGRYGYEADESRPGWTPLRLVEKRKMELEELYDLWDLPSTPSDCSDNDNPAMKAARQRRERIRKFMCPDIPDWRTHPPLPDHLPTRSSRMRTASASSNHASATSENQTYPPTVPETITTTRPGGKKRRRLVSLETEEDDERAIQPVTKTTRTVVAIPHQARRSVRIRNVCLRRGDG